ncbi:MAG: DUF1003 domain-containing protein [Candidatus Woesearchaeota archaeon]|nr:DUF1003 domain-containing protein [Candidatus Woesearchaeota archaeon]
MARKKVYHRGNVVPTSGIYECSACDNITAFKKGEKFTNCDDCEATADQQVWIDTHEIVRFVTKNLNVEFESNLPVSYRVAHFLGETVGNIWFFYIHVVWFGMWIYLNTGVRITTEYGGFDPYPFPFLVLIVSLEAIFLATFILIAQNIQESRGQLRADLDYQARLKLEKEVAEALSILSDVKEGRLTLTKNKKIVFEEDS